MRILAHGLLILVVVAVVGGCSGLQPPTADERQSQLHKETGAPGAYSWSLDGRIAALEAFLGQRAVSDAEWTETTIEGVTLQFSVHATPGTLVWRRDLRPDGGSIEQFTLVNVELVRYVPSVWQNNTEIAKEYVVPVSVADARAQPDARYYLRGRCSADACEHTF